VGIDYEELRQQNAAALARLRAEQAEHLETHPELLVAQARRLVGRAKIIERNASDLPDMIIKRRDNSLVGPSEAQPTADDGWNNWWTACFLEMWTSSVEPAIGEGLNIIRDELLTEIEKLRAEIDELKKQRDAT
jgi:hypothetical protein